MEFPSPYGVSFILIWDDCAPECNICDVSQSFRLLTEYHSFLLTGEIKAIEMDNLCKFPSPYGVSFILIISKLFSLSALQVLKVSVSLRSIIHSY